jgi:signal transduction histidine kinase
METNTIILIFLAASFSVFAAILIIYLRKIPYDISRSISRPMEEILYRNEKYNRASDPEELRFLMNKLNNNIESFMSFQEKFQSYFEEDRINYKSLDKFQMRIMNYFDENRHNINEQKEFVFIVKNLEEKLMNINYQFENKFDKMLHQNSSGSNPQIISKIEKLNSQLSTQLEKTEQLLSLQQKPFPNEEFAKDLAKKISSEYSHSIKTPLSSVSTAISNLSNNIIPIIKSNKDNIKDSEVLISMLENAKTSIEYIYKIIERGAGFLPGKIEEFKLNDTIRKAIRINREASGINPKIELKLTEFKEFKLNWFSVFISLIQVLENAFEAIKEVKDGVIEIETKQIDSTNSVEIIISNNGKQIKKADLDKIFLQDFSTKGVGRGLGLSIAQRNLDEIKGKIELIESKELTRFRIVFPINNI